MSDKESALRAGTAKSLKLLAGSRFITFRNSNHLYINLPTNDDDPRVELPDGVSTADVNSKSVLSLPAGTIGTSNYGNTRPNTCLLYTSPSPRDRQKSRMPSSA